MARNELTSIMLRPRSLALLVGAIVLAVGFSLFAQWQLGRAVQNGAVVERETEVVHPIDEVTAAQRLTDSDAVGQLVSATGSWAPGEFVVLQDRIDKDRSGFWVAGHFLAEDGDSIAVAIGWTADEERAVAAARSWNRAADELPGEIVGRYQQSEGPTVPDDGRAYAKEMSVPALLGEWAEPGPTYAGYVTLQKAPDELEPIFSPPAVTEVQLNLLNLFYATEWTLFALVALYIWYRHMKDILEKEREERLLAEAERSGADPVGASPHPE